MPLLDNDHIFRKKPYYDADHFESMNIKLDRIQKAVFGVPGWVTQARENLQDNPQYAFQLAYAGIVSDACKLHKSLRQLRRVADNNKTTHNISKYS